MTRTSVRRRRLVTAVLLSLALAPVAGRALGAVADGPAADPSTRSHVVREGDTLWSIARATVGPEGDPRPVVDGIRGLNGVDPGALVPGTRLVLPQV